MTDERKAELNKLMNLALVEELLKLQSDVDRYHQLRANADYRSDDWEKYHNKLYETISEVVEVKYMVVHRMGGCVGTGE